MKDFFLSILLNAGIKQLSFQNRLLDYGIVPGLINMLIPQTIIKNK